MHVKKYNHEWNMTHVRELVEAKRDEQNADTWAAAYKHMREYAVKQWAADEVLLQEEEEDDEDD